MARGSWRRGASASLLFKPFVTDAKPPRWFQRTTKPLELTPGRVNVTCFLNGWCTSGLVTAERARRVAGEFGETVVFREIDTSEHRAVAEWGLADALFVDRKQVVTGPPIARPAAEDSQEEAGARGALSLAPVRAPAISRVAAAAGSHRVRGLSPASLR